MFLCLKAALGISSLAITAFVGLEWQQKLQLDQQHHLLHSNVVQVESELGGVETINQNSFSTSRNHGENTYILQRKKWAMAKTHLLK